MSETAEFFDSWTVLIAEVLKALKGVTEEIEEVE